MRRGVTGYGLRIMGFVIALLFSLSAFGQSNLTYELKVGTTGENALLATFPESYAGEKVNIKLRVESLEFRDLDYIFADKPQPIVDRFDSIYSYTDEAKVTWTVWRNHKEIKNRSQRVLVGNAYKVFEEYILQETAAARCFHR